MKRDGERSGWAVGSAQVGLGGRVAAIRRALFVLEKWIHVGSQSHIFAGSTLVFGSFKVSGASLCLVLLANWS